MHAVDAFQHEQIGTPRAPDPRQTLYFACATTLLQLPFLPLLAHTPHLPDHANVHTLGVRSTFEQVVHCPLALWISVGSNRHKDALQRLLLLLRPLLRPLLFLLRQCRLSRCIQGTWLALGGRMEPSSDGKPAVVNQS